MITYIFSIIILFVSLFGFWSDPFFNSCTFSPSLMKNNYNETIRRTLFYSLVHVHWLHLIMNLFTFFILGCRIESTVGSSNYLRIIILASIITPLFTYFYHVNTKNYHSVGFSGITSCLMTLGLFICPSWIFILWCIIAMAEYIFFKKDWIAQEIHISGHVLGIILGLLFNIFHL